MNEQSFELAVQQREQAALSELAFEIVRDLFSNTPRSWFSCDKLRKEVTEKHTLISMLGLIDEFNHHAYMFQRNDLIISIRAHDDIPQLINQLVLDKAAEILTLPKQWKNLAPFDDKVEQIQDLMRAVRAVPTFNKMMEQFERYDLITFA
ncbi:hypothetical protein [Algicola sagamiensis]|uniref:hypothetical protein n=1 Tax=Algicola sagamiensis TaxID=163869 RepID=UPI000366C5C9|nr:hypothetical protein [Algicola sagamiensis]